MEKATSTSSKIHTSEVSGTGAELESSPPIGTDGRKEMGVLGAAGNKHVSPGTAGCQADRWGILTVGGN